IAREVAGFLSAAKHSLDLAQYDFHLSEATSAVVGGALKEAHARGVAVRILYNVDHANPIPVPPPPEPDVQLIASLGVPARAVAGVPDLMHHKYVVRDGEALWTGSMNWTDDSWSVQENVVVTVASQELAHAFTLDFEELWGGADVEHSGFVEPRPVEVDGIKVRPWFTPGFADALTARIAKKIGHAEKVRILSPVITSAPVLGTLAQRIADGRGDIAGCVDATQVTEVMRQWQADGAVAADRDAAQLHAREGRDRRRHGVRRVVQPLALGREERRERARADRRGARRASERVRRRGACALPRGRLHRRSCRLTRARRPQNRPPRPCLGRNRHTFGTKARAV